MCDLVAPTVEYRMPWTSLGVVVADPGFEQQVGMKRSEGREERWSNTLWVMLLLGTDAMEIFAGVVGVRW